METWLCPSLAYPIHPESLRSPVPTSAVGFIPPGFCSHAGPTARGTFPHFSTRHRLPTKLLCAITSPLDTPYSHLHLLQN